MYTVHPCLNSSKIDLVFITDIVICLSGYGYFPFPLFPKIIFVLQVAKFSSLNACTLKKKCLKSVWNKNGMVQKMLWKGRIVCTTWGMPIKHFCKFALFKQSRKTVFGKHLHVILLIFMSGFLSNLYFWFFIAFVPQV